MNWCLQDCIVAVCHLLCIIISAFVVVFLKENESNRPRIAH